LKICVLGCGPAGAVTALGLRRLGYHVSLVGEVRSYPVTEGISARVCQALAGQHLHHSLRQVSSPVRRHAQWSGQGREANTESLVYRPDFDRALIRDLAEHEVPWTQGRIGGRSRQDGRWVITLDKSTGPAFLEADFLVEARGRAANLEGKDRLRGPETVSVGLNWSMDPGQAFTAVTGLEDGWLWLAGFEDGRLFSQYTTHAKNSALSPKRNIPPLIDGLLAGLRIPGVSLETRQPAGDPFARSSTPILPAEPADSALLRVGDAAMAVDPLSGNGIFQSLSSALAAPAVINTLVKRPEDGAMALDFYRDRLRHLFFRFARIGRDFYAQEVRWADREFWKLRAHWPDGKPAHAATDRVIGRAERPVIHHGFIEKRIVVLTEDQPLGAAHVAAQEDSS
jgi:flavin-dependent dehydrogenase